MADESLENSSVQALVTLKEGKGNSYNQTPPRRGHPPRIRKKNQRFFNDDEETDYSPIRSPKKQPKASTSALQTVHQTRTNNQYLSAADKRVAQTIGLRLRNLLKLPKAHRWVCYEFFYSNLDIPLFLSENDFSICIKETFPQLKAKKLKRVEWIKIRRLMGKPRRCSPAFFSEEREALEQRRNRIRLLQQRKLGELTSFKDLPEEIPMHLVIGTKVTARLRKPQDGLFTGTVEALDTVTNSYRVTFDRPGIGTHSIPDHEVLSNGNAETIPLSAFQQKHRPRHMGGLFSPPRFIPGSGSTVPHLDNDPLLSGSPFRGRLMSLEGGTYGGFPIKFLVLVLKNITNQVVAGVYAAFYNTRLSKILMIKKEWIHQVNEMNTEAEKKKSYQQPITVEFQKKYANIVLELERLNKDLNEYLVGVQEFCNEIAPEQGLPAYDQPNEIKKKCEEEGQAIVDRIGHNVLQTKKTLKNDNILHLITKLTSLMLQVRTFSESEFNSFECKSLQDSLKDIKETLDLNNITTFENNVEIHINHIQSGLSQMGNLHAFTTNLLT